MIAYAIVGLENSHTGNTKQIVCGELMAAAKAMVIAQYDGEESFYLFGIYGDEWKEQSDTWHETYESAVEQMDWEYQNLSSKIVVIDKTKVTQQGDPGAAAARRP